jgi:hypothetical protein
MKTITTLILSGALAVSTVSCTTTYDAYGNPRQSVDPGTAAAGVAAAGVLGYAIARNRDDGDRHHHYYRSHPRHHRGYYDRGRHYRRY